MKNILIILGCLFLSQTLYGGPKLGRFTSLSTLCAAQLGELGLKQKDPDILKRHLINSTIPLAARDQEAAKNLASLIKDSLWMQFFKTSSVRVTSSHVRWSLPSWLKDFESSKRRHSEKKIMRWFLGISICVSAAVCVTTLKRGAQGEEVWMLTFLSFVISYIGPKNILRSWANFKYRNFDHRWIEDLMSETSEFFHRIPLSRREFDLIRGFPSAEDSSGTDDSALRAGQVSMDKVSLLRELNRTRPRWYQSKPYELQIFSWSSDKDKVEDTEVPDTNNPYQRIVFRVVKR